MSNIINVKTLKGKEIFWYESMPEWKVIIGVRGVGEFKIDKWTIMRAEDSFRWRNGRPWTDEEGLEWAINYAQKESEYIEFEEVPNKVLFLGDGVSKNPGLRQNETK